MATDVTGLQVLAQERATRIKNYLVQEGQIPDERVVPTWAEIDEVAKGDTVRTNLTLAGS
jgi:protein subunit release factor A